MHSILNKALAVILSICFFYLPIKAENFKFHHLSRGLSQNTGTQVYQDRYGFLWFGTRNGLNHYDGVNIKVYESISQDESTLSNNYIVGISEDSEGNLWVGTQVGLNLYNRDKDNFTRFLPDKENEKSIVHNRINNIVEDSNGNIWCAGQSLYLFDMNSGIFDKYSTDQFSNHDPEFNKVFLDSKNNLWFVSHKQLYIFNTSNKEFNLVFDGIKHPLSKNENWFFRNIAEANDGKYWAVTDKAGLYSFEYDNKMAYPKFNKHVKELGLDAYGLSSIFMESEDRYWVAAENFGLILFNPIDENFTLLKNDPDDIKSLSSNSVWCIYKDRAEKIWFGTFNTGFDYLDPYGEKFTHYQYEKKKGSLSHNNVSIFLGEPNGNLWVGTDGGGLNYLDQATQQFTYFRHDPKQPGSLLSDAILALCFDENGRLWVGGWDVGVNILNSDKRTFTRLTVENSSLPSNRIFALGNDNKGNMYIGTWRSGLAVYNVHSSDWNYYKTNESETSLSGDFISTIYRDRSDKVWIGTVGYGLNVARSGDDGKLLFTRYEHNSADSASLSNNHVNCVYEDEQNNFWIGTKNGLNLLDRETGKFTVYGKKDGLKSNYINSVLDDGKGNLWLGTLKGLIQFNPQTGDVRNYDSQDGVQGDQFNAHAMYKSEDGRLYFAGTNGFNAFYPDKIKYNPIIPPVVFTDFKLFNKSVLLGKNSVLTDHVSMSDHITLAYNQTVFSFDFVALNFTHPDKNQYAYKLEGFDQDWNNVGKKRSASYTNLDPGEYQLKVIASNNDGKWNMEGTAIDIVITPPFWKTVWFRTLSFLTIVALIYLVYKIRIRGIQRQKEKLEEQVIERTKEIQEAKKETDDILQNVKDGLFLIDREYRIESQYSAALETILSESDLSKKSFIDYIKEKVDSEVVNNTEQYLEILLNQDIDEDIISELNPLTQIEFQFNSGNIEKYTTKHLAFDFRRIKENGRAIRIIATVSDVTEKINLMRNLEESKEENKRKMEMLLGVLNVDPTMLKEFIKTVQNEMDHIQNIVKDFNIKSIIVEKIEEIYRSIHTVKGNANMLELDFIANKAHAFEETLEELKKKPEIGSKELHVLIDEIESIQDMHSEVKEIINKISNIHEQFRPKRGYENKMLIKSLTRLVKSLGDKHKKQAKLIIDNYNGDIMPYKHRLLIRDVLVQLVRNSMVHGIEDNKIRKSAGKEKIGKIEISNRQNGKYIAICFKDDGCGLRIDKLREKAKASGKWRAEEIESWTDEKLSEIILESGITTAKSIGLAAGRGVGMNIIKSKVTNAGGKIEIENQPGQSLTFNIFLPKEEA